MIDYIVALLCLVPVCFIISGICGAIFCIRGDEADKHVVAGILFIISLLLATLFSYAPFNCPVRDIVIKYDQPTSVIKTNNLVVVLYIKDGYALINNLSSDIKLWNSDIMIEYKEGKTIFGSIEQGSYKVIVKEDK